MHITSILFLLVFIISTSAHAERFIVISLPNANFPSSALFKSSDPVTGIAPPFNGTIFSNTFEVFTGKDALIPFGRRSIMYVDVSNKNVELFSVRDIPNGAYAARDLLSTPLLDEVPKTVGADIKIANGYTGKEKYLAILDTGSDASHPMLHGKVVEEACFGTNDSTRSIFSICPGFRETVKGEGAARPPVNLFNSFYHGTHVAAIALGKKITTNNVTISGIAPDAKLIAINVFSKYIKPVECFPNSSPCLRSTTRDQIRGLFHVFELRQRYDIAAVVMSLGAMEAQDVCDNRPMKYIIEMLNNVGIPVVAASGNDASINSMRFPACFTGSISVAHTERDGSTIAAEANRTGTLKMSAPGVAVLSAVPGGGYLRVSGSSQATPMVAGAIALLAQKFEAQGITDKTQRLEKILSGLNEFAKDSLDPRRSFFKVKRLYIGSGP